MFLVQMRTHSKQPLPAPQMWAVVPGLLEEAVSPPTGSFVPNPNIVELKSVTEQPHEDKCDTYSDVAPRAFRVACALQPPLDAVLTCGWADASASIFNNLQAAYDVWQSSVTATSFNQAAQTMHGM